MPSESTYPTRNLFSSPEWKSRFSSLGPNLRLGYEIQVKKGLRIAVRSDSFLVDYEDWPTSGILSDPQIESYYCRKNSKDYGNDDPVSSFHVVAFHGEYPTASYRSFVAQACRCLSSGLSELMS